MDAQRTNRLDVVRHTRRTNRSEDAAHRTRRINRSHIHVLSNLPNAHYNFPAPFMAMPPHPYYQYSRSHYHIMMNNFMIAPPSYYAPPPPRYVRSEGIQRPLPPQDPELYPNIVRQIEYYFSEENLVTDTYLKSKMDRYGWVDVSVIAEFRRIKALTGNIYHILEALVFSSTVHVRAYKMRTRYDWKKWIDPSNSQAPTPSS